MSTSKNSFLVYTAPPGEHFQYGRKYREDQVNKVFQDLLAAMQVNFLPGLVLQDHAGFLYRPKLVVKLEPTHLPSTEEVP